MTGRAAVRLELPYDTRAPQQGRLFLAEFIARTGWPGSSNDAALVLGELVANAIQHAHAGCCVAMTVDHHRLRIEVRDEGDAVVVHAVHDDQHRGQGLRIVAHVAEMWGWHTQRHGKTVWAELVPVASVTHP